MSVPETEERGFFVTYTAMLEYGPKELAADCARENMRDLIRREPHFGDISVVEMCEREDFKDVDEYSREEMLEVLIELETTPGGTRTPELQAFKDELEEILISE